MSRHLGFTGTRHGMTDKQRMVVAKAVESAVKRLPYVGEDRLIIHHGDCVGADAEFHDITGPRCKRIGHLPEDDTHRAFCTFDETRSPLPHMKRNKAIVAESDAMIATPYESAEQERGGTWKTIGFTRKANKPLAIVWPDGVVTLERWP